MVQIDTSNFSRLHHCFVYKMKQRPGLSRELLDTYLSGGKIEFSGHCYIDY